MSPSSPPPLRPDSLRVLAQRGSSVRAPWGSGGSLGLSTLAHGAVLAAVLLAGGEPTGGATRAQPVVALHLAQATEDLDRPPVPVEPLPVPEEVPEPPPELVEAPDEPEMLPEEASLAELPLDDPLGELASLKRPSAPPAEEAPVLEEVPLVPPVSGVAGPPPSAPVEPAPDGPEELEGDRLPEVLEGPLPGYPERALRFRRQGTVRVRGVVAADGGVLSVEVVESSGHEELDHAATTAFRRWRFVPRGDGAATERIVVKPFVFRLP